MMRRGACLGLLMLAWVALPGLRAGAQESSATALSADDETLDRVIAVVNTQVILASDLDLEIRLSRLIPGGDPLDRTPLRALGQANNARLD